MILGYISSQTNICWYTTKICSTFCSTDRHIRVQYIVSQLDGSVFGQNQSDFFLTYKNTHKQVGEY